MHSDTDSNSITNCSDQRTNKSKTDLYSSISIENGEKAASFCDIESSSEGGREIRADIVSVGVIIELVFEFFLASSAIFVFRRKDTLVTALMRDSIYKLILSRSVMRQGKIVNIHTYIHTNLFGKGFKKRSRGLMWTYYLK